MKKLVLPLVMLLTLSASAQTFQVGIKAGVNISNYTGGDFSDVEKNALIGFHGGGFISFFLGKNLAIQPELLFSTQGVKIEDAGEEQKLKVAYINIPIMLKYRFDGGFYLEAGPQFGFKVSEDVPDMGVEDFAKSTDVGIAAGLGYHTKMGLGIGARYIAGVSKVGDFDASNIDPDFKNSVIQVSLFYTIFNKSNKKN